MSKKIQNLSVPYTEVENEQASADKQRLMSYTVETEPGWLEKELSDDDDKVNAAFVLCDASLFLSADLVEDLLLFITSEGIVPCSIDVGPSLALKGFYDRSVSSWFYKDSIDSLNVDPKFLDELKKLVELRDPAAAFKHKTIAIDDKVILFYYQ